MTPIDRLVMALSGETQVTPVGEVIPFPRQPFRLSKEELDKAMAEIRANATWNTIPLVPINQWPPKK